jgi:putative transposase
MKRAFRYRFYPTVDQAAQLSRTFGCVRKVYNLALAARSEAWTSRQETITYNATSAMLTAWKKTEDLAFLGEVSCVPLQQTLRHLQAAFTGFFAKRSGYPRFKSKKLARASAEYTASAFRYRDGMLTLAKMAEPLDIVWSRPLPDGATPSTVTVSCDSARRWHVSILCEDTVPALAESDRVVGLDVGIESLITLSTGEKVSNPRHGSRDQVLLARAQRALSRKINGSQNRAKARLRVAKVSARIADRRKDHLHQVTTRIVRENQAIVIEDLAVRSMARNRFLAKAIHDAAWRQLREMLEYKADWYGRELIIVNRWFPSSRLCSECGVVADKLPLQVRSWQCLCGAVHDRDVNAARNILAEGLSATACGAGVSPRMENLRPGRSVPKQEAQRVTAGIPRLRARVDEVNP